MGGGGRATYSPPLMSDRQRQASIRVAFSLLTLFPGRAGGSETYVRGLLGEFARRAEFEQVTVLANEAVMSAYAGAGVPLLLMPTYRTGRSDLTRFFAMNAGRVRPTLARGDFDVVHYPVTVPIPRAPPTPTVVTLHDVQHHELRSMFSPAERWLRGWAYDDAARRADAVVTKSEHAKAAIVRHLGIAAERIAVIPDGLHHDMFVPDGPRAAHLPARYVVYSANFWPHKNHRRLLEAFARVQDDSLHLVLTGQLNGYAAQLADRKRVHVLGHVPFEQLPAIYRGAVAVVFPSLFEGFGLPVLEGMACGTPVACSNTGATPEVAGGAALLFDPRDEDAIVDAIEQVSSDQALRMRLRAAGLARAAQFTWAKCAAAHASVYRAVVAGVDVGAAAV
jgi:glycosyltransferase involved in cell wall biosynthesis